MSLARVTKGTIKLSSFDVLLSCMFPERITLEILLSIHATQKIQLLG